MSRTKLKPTPLVREIGQKVRVVRTSLGLSQSKLAERLRVSRSQVAEWENGKEERPSAERLLEIAKIAPSKDLRSWFLTTAGVDLEMVKEDFHQEVQFAPTTGPGRSLKLPVWRVQSKSLDGGVIQLPMETLPFPTELAPHPLMTIWLKTGERWPWFLRDGDLFVVDRSVTDPRYLLGKVSVFYLNPYPASDSRIGSEEYSMLLDAAKSWRSNPVKDRPLDNVRRVQRGAAYQVRPGFIVGWFDIQFSSDFMGRDDEDEEREPDPNPWRLILRTGSISSHIRRVVPLSNWQIFGHPLEDESIDLEPLIRQGAEIFGQVLAWASPESSSSWGKLTGTIDPDMPD